MSDYLSYFLVSIVLHLLLVVQVIIYLVESERVLQLAEGHSVDWVTLDS